MSRLVCGGDVVQHIKTYTKWEKKTFAQKYLQCFHAKIIWAHCLTLLWHLRLHCLCRTRPQDNQSCAWKSWKTVRNIACCYFFLYRSSTERKNERFVHFRLFFSLFSSPEWNTYEQTDSTWWKWSGLYGTPQVIRTSRRQEIHCQTTVKTHRQPVKYSSHCF